MINTQFNLFNRRLLSMQNLLFAYSSEPPLDDNKRKAKAEAYYQCILNILETEQIPSTVDRPLQQFLQRIKKLKLEKPQLTQDLTVLMVATYQRLKNDMSTEEYLQLAEQVSQCKVDKASDIGKFMAVIGFFTTVSALVAMYVWPQIGPTSITCASFFAIGLGYSLSPNEKGLPDYMAEIDRTQAKEIPQGFMKFCP